MGTSYEDIRRQKFTYPILGVGLTLDATMGRKNLRISMLELQEKTRKKIQGLCLLSLLKTYCFSLTQLLYSLSFSWRLCLSTFTMTGSQQGPTTTIDVAIQPLTCSSTWWYKCLFGAAMVQHQVDGDTSWCARNSPKRLRKETRWIGNPRRNQDYPDNSIVEIGQNTEKSPGDPRRLALHSDSSEE